MDNFFELSSFSSLIIYFNKKLLLFFVLISVATSTIDGYNAQYSTKIKDDDFYKDGLVKSFLEWFLLSVENLDNFFENEKSMSKGKGKGKSTFNINKEHYNFNKLIKYKTFLEIKSISDKLILRDLHYFLLMYIPSLNKQSSLNLINGFFKNTFQVELSEHKAEEYINNKTIKIIKKGLKEVNNTIKEHYEEYPPKEKIPTHIQFLKELDNVDKLLKNKFKHIYLL